MQEGVKKGNVRWKERRRSQTEEGGEKGDVRQKEKK